MDVGANFGIYSEALHLTAVREADRVLDLFEGGLRRLGATHLLLTGLPLPRRSVIKLIVRVVWPDLRNGGHVIDLPNGDPLLDLCLSARRPFVVRAGRVVPGLFATLRNGSDALTSDLLAAAGGDKAEIVAVPIHDLHPYQGCVIMAGPALATAHESLTAIEYYCLNAFRTLLEVGRLDLARPGDLSERERHVLKLTAAGKTAAEIADLLAISQRTVHAHLQNASDKMNASNKTHTVVEALRYGQITL